MKSNLSIRNLLIGLVIVIVLAVIVMRGDQLVELAETMRHGYALPLVLAILTQLGKYTLQSVAYVFTFAAVGEKYEIRHTLPLVFGTFFMNTIAPSANLAGITLVVDDARRRGIDPGHAGSAALLMQITIDSGFGVIVVIGFSALALTVGLPVGWFLLGLLDIAVVSVMISIIVLSKKKPATVVKVFSWAELLVNRVLAKFKRDPMKPWAKSTAASFSEAAGLIASNPKPTAKAFLCSIGASCCELSCFVLVGISFGITEPEALVCGYVVATLFAMFSITPQGVGFVETAVLVAFTTFGVSSAAGLSTAVVYRGIVFWMPFLIGAVLIQMTSTFKDSGKKKADAAPEAASELPDGKKASFAAQRAAAAKGAAAAPEAAGDMAGAEHPNEGAPNDALREKTGLEELARASKDRAVESLPDEMFERPTIEDVAARRSAK